MNIEEYKIMCKINTELGKYLRVSMAYSYICGKARLPGLNTASPLSKLCDLW